MIESEDSGWGSSGSSSSKRKVLFVYIAILLLGVGLSVWFSATYYFADEAVDCKYPGTALVAGTSGLVVWYMKPFLSLFLSFSLVG